MLLSATSRCVCCVVAVFRFVFAGLVVASLLMSCSQEPASQGMERAAGSVPAADGGNVSLGSDFPAAAYVADYKPLNAITQAVTRQMLGQPDMPILGGEGMRLTVAQAIRANTWGAAYGIGVEDEIGSLEVGKKADLILLEQNLFDIDPHQIHNARVLLTMMDGMARHRDGI